MLGLAGVVLLTTRRFPSANSINALFAFFFSLHTSDMYFCRSSVAFASSSQHAQHCSRHHGNHLLPLIKLTYTYDSYTIFLPCEVFDLRLFLIVEDLSAR
jgi:hypothetical protein